jgi:hypothetical protein
MTWFAETMRCIFRPAVSRARAVELVRAEFERRAFPWREPVAVRAGLVCYTVLLGSGRGTVFVKVDRRDGSIRHIGIPPA